MVNVNQKEKQYVYFMHSISHEKRRNEIEKSINKMFVPGKVLVRGAWVDFTHIATANNVNSPMYSDAIIVAEGYKEDMNFKHPKSIFPVQAQVGRM